MSQTIKDKISTQIYFNQQLLSYDHSDSSQNSDEEIDPSTNVHLNVNTKANSFKENINTFQQDTTNQHGQMVQKRRQVLKSLENQNQPIPNTSIKSKQESSLLKHKSKQEQSANENKTIVQLKSKLAQLFKESQEKTYKIKQLQQNASRKQIEINELEGLLKQKQISMEQKENSVQKSLFQNQKLTEQYQLRLHQLEQELQAKNVQISQARETIETKNERLNELENLLESRNQQISQIEKNQSIEKNYISQNKRLKKDVTKLLSLLQTYNDNQIKEKSHKKTIQPTFNPSKYKNTRSISIGSQSLHRNTKNKTNKSFYKMIQGNYLSINQKAQAKIAQKNPTQWFPTVLVSQVERFLKKWHIAQNNHKFVSSLTEFINVYTEKCLSQNRLRMENQYKSLKKQIQRKANHSLAFQQVIKQRQLRIKSNTSQSHKKASYNCRTDFKTQNTILSEDDISILIPASNKKNFQHRNDNFSSLTLLDEKNLQKDDIGYNNLQKSIRLHHKTSTNQIALKAPSELKINQQIMRIFHKEKSSIQHRKTKTESSNDGASKYPKKRGQKFHKQKKKQ